MLVAAISSLVAVAPVTVAPATAAQPRSLITYGNRGLYVADHSGRDPRLVVEPVGNGLSGPYNPAFSPDGSHIAYMNAGDIFVISTDGRTGRKVTVSGDNNIPRWSADGSRIYYVGGDAGNTGIGWVSSSADAFAEGHEEHALPGTGYDTSPVPSPHRDLLAISTKTSEYGYGVDLIDADGGTRRPLLRSGDRVVNHPIDWSPDGSQLLVLRIVDMQRSDVVVLGADGRGERTIRGSAMPIAWAPDGTRILFTDASKKFMSMRPDGSGVVSLGLASTGGGDGDWGPGSVDAITSEPPAQRDASPETAPSSSVPAATKTVVGGARTDSSPAATTATAGAPQVDSVSPPTDLEGIKVPVDATTADVRAAASAGEAASPPAEHVDVDASRDSPSIWPVIGAFAALLAVLIVGAAELRTRRRLQRYV